MKGHAGPNDDILIIADIEGSSGCWDRQASSFLTDAWSRACLEMTRDVNAVVQALLQAGVKQIRIKDFHRTGYNLLPERINSRAEIISGYRRGPVPGIGDPGTARAVMFLGMHAASGTPGFLAHTLTSRIECLEVNGEPMAEVELFAASLAPFGVRPIFFSGCPLACQQAQKAIANISVFALDKSSGIDGFDGDAWRSDLTHAVIQALDNDRTRPYQPTGPFRAAIRMRGGPKTARKICARWGYASDGAQILIDANDIHTLYDELIKMCYLTPGIENMLSVGLFIYNLWGRFGLAWARRRLRRQLAGK